MVQKLLKGACEQWRQQLLTLPGFTLLNSIGNPKKLLKIQQNGIDE